MFERARDISDPFNLTSTDGENSELHFELGGLYSFEFRYAVRKKDDSFS